MKRAAAVIILCTIALGLTSCFVRGQDSDGADTGAATSFRDISGITQDEIDAIDKLLDDRQVFTLGSLHAFEYADGTYGGFVPQLGRLLTDLFGVPFVTEINTWQKLYERVNAHTLDFNVAISMQADIECHYIHTSPIAENHISVYTLSGAEADIRSEYDLRDRKVGFYAGSFIEKMLRRAYPYVDYQSVDIFTADEMAAKLLAGEIDVFITDTPEVFAYYEYSHIAKAKSFPHVYVPVTISTANPELEPVISAITRYLMAGGIGEIDRIYDIGEHEYASHAIWQTLSSQERAYIENLAASGQGVPVGATASRYPVAFYSKEDSEYQGIAVDVLSEISKLTGIEFYYNCDETTSWGELEGMLRTGEIALLSQLIPNEPRSEYAIWPDAPYFTARYALLSNLDYPFLSVDHVPYATVGLVAGTAEETRYRAWFPEDESYKTYTTTDEGLSALEAGEIDLFFSLDYTMLYESNYRENPNQKINILFDDPVEPVPFGLNKNEEILCSIISKAQGIINTDRIARSWTSRIFDQSAQEAEQRFRMMALFAMCLLVLLFVISMLLAGSQRLKRKVENQAEAAQEASRNLQVLIDMAPVGIIISSRGDGNILYSNKAALDMFGCKSFDRDVAGLTTFDFMPELQPDGLRSDDAIREIWRHDEGNVELYCRKQDGEEFLARVAYYAISYYGTHSTINVIEDITAEKEYRRRLKDAAKKEQEANQLKSQFLATMSHEIRTPMNAIIGMADLALRETELGTKNDHILTIKQAGANLLSIINDILDFSKIEAGRMEIIPAEYSVASLINDVVNIIRMRAVDTKLQFAVKADCNIPRTLIGDETRIRQALLNILNNAVKYTEEGYVVLGVYVDKKQAKDGECVNLTFEVTDTGIGIKPENIEKVFDDFTQLQHDSGKTIEGVGLGLAITRSIVEAMGGRIDVKSEYGKGSTFTITIPQEAGSGETLAAVGNKKRKGVLVYVSGSVCADSIAYALDSLGIDFVSVKNDAEFAGKMASREYDYLFISFDLFKANAEKVRLLGKNMEIGILSGFGEVNPTGSSILGKNMTVLTMPIYCTSVADVLGGAYKDVSYAEGKEDAIRFFAPDARVLVVDDIKSNLKVAEGLLLQYKMKVDLINSGAGAIDAVLGKGKSGESYDLVFMDHKMPGMDGVEATRRIRELEEAKEARNIPIIALTANAVADMEEMFMKNGFNDFLSKPIDTTRLGDLLEKWLPKAKQIKN